MPLLIESLDDEVVRDGSPLFDGGQMSNARSSALNSNQLSLLQNCDISITGRLTTRRGTVSIGGSPFAHPILGIGYLDTPTIVGNVVIVVSDGTFGRVKYWNGTAWLAPATPFDMSPVLPVQMVQGIDKLWIVQEGFSLSYWDGTFNPVVPNGGTTTAPVKPAFVEWHTDRLVCAGMPTLPDTITFSQFLDGTVWDHANWDVRIGAGDGDPITQIVSWSNFNLVVLKEHSVWVVNCNPQLADAITGNISTFPVNPVHKRIGCLAGRSAVQVGADVFFLSDSGIRSVAQTLASESQQAVGPALSEPINDIIERVNPAALGSVVGYYWKSRYFCALPIDGATSPNYTVVFNTLTKSWSGYWTGITPTCFTRRVHGTTPKLTFGQSTGTVVDFQDYIAESSASTSAYQDLGADIPSTIISKAYTCGDPDSPKTGFFNRMEFNRSAATVTVSYFTDDSTDEIVAESFATDSGTLTLPLMVPFDFPGNGALAKSLDLQHLGQWREIQVKIASTAGKVSLNKIAIGAFQDSFVLQA